MKERRPHQKFSKTIRDFRYDFGLTQSEFANRLGVKQGTISKIEAGYILPGTKLLMEMRRVFQLNINQLFDWVNQDQYKDSE